MPKTAEELWDYFAENADKWAEEFLGMRLSDKQKELLISGNKNPHTIAIYARQSGKTQILSLLCIHRLIFGKGITNTFGFHLKEHIGVFAPIKEQITDPGRIRDRVVSLLKSNPLLEQMVKISAMSIETIDGNILEFMSASPGAHIRGATLTYIVCLPYGERIMTNRGLIPIGDIVKKKINIKVLSYNHKTKKTEWKRIKRWFKNPLGKRKIIEIAAGGRTLHCTDNHPIFTERGYKKACEVKKGETIYIPRDSLLYERPLGQTTDRKTEANRSGKYSRRRFDYNQATRQANRCKALEKWPRIYNESSRRARTCGVHAINQKEGLYRVEVERIRTVCWEDGHTREQSGVRRKDNAFYDHYASLLHRTKQTLPARETKDSITTDFGVDRTIRARDMVHGRWLGFWEQCRSLYSRLLFRREPSDKRLVDGEVGDRIEDFYREKNRQTILDNNRKGTNKIIRNSETLHSFELQLQGDRKEMSCVWKDFYQGWKQRILLGGVPKEKDRRNQKANKFETTKEPSRKAVLNLWSIVQAAQRNVSLLFEEMFRNTGESDRQGKILQESRQSTSQISNVESEAEREKFVYNIEVEDNNNYFAEGILVHNCDESQDIIDEKYYADIMPMASTTAAPMVEAGTPATKNHFWYSLTTGSVKVIKQYWHECPFYAPGFIEERKKQMPEAQFNREYCLEFSEESTTVFPTEDVQMVLEDYPLFTTIEEAKRNWNKIWDGGALFTMGVDLGKETDSTVITVARTDRLPMRVVFQKEIIQRSYVHIAQEIRKVYDAFIPGEINVDYTGEKGVTDELIALGVPIETSKERECKTRGAVIFDNNTKAAMVSVMQVLIQKSRRWKESGGKEGKLMIELPKGSETLFYQFTTQQYELSSSGKYKFFHPEGHHDDFLWSTLLAFANVSVEFDGETTSFSQLGHKGEMASANVWEKTEEKAANGSEDSEKDIAIDEVAFAKGMNAAPDKDRQAKRQRVRWLESI